MLTPEQRFEVIRILQQGEDLSPEWARIIFPPERREYELLYHGKDREEDILANTLAVPLQAVRAFGPANRQTNWQNMLIFGDNLQALKSLVDARRARTLTSADGSPGVRLVYIDPPFATMQEFRGSDDQKAFQDKVAGARFIEFLRRRLVFLREVMADDSTIYVHLDTKKSHYLKVVMDEVFGESSFRNEIIWKRTNARSTPSMWPRVHDSILVYTKGAGAAFQPQVVKAEKKKLPHTLITGPDGQKYQTYELTAQGVTQDGESGRPWRGYDPSSFGRHWANSQNQREQWDAEGLIHWPKKTRPTKGKNSGFPRRRAEEPFDPESRTVVVGDVWTDIDRINQSAEERSGYPTQKPEELIARILAASSREGDLILDAFAGSGTTCAVAEKMQRRWIAIDCGKLAVYTIQKRMLNLREKIGHRGEAFRPSSFTLFNAGLYDFSRLKELPWDSWRFFSLQLFQCTDSLHKVGGVQLDGRLKGASVLVFNHMQHAGVRIDEQTIASLHESLGSRIGNRLFIIAPALSFDFQQDYIQLGGVRYYALRIPYSIIHELHQREFTALRQPSDELAVNDTVDAVGFDFVRTPELKFSALRAVRDDDLFEQGIIKLAEFTSDAAVREPFQKDGKFETLSMVMLDLDYDDSTSLFEMDLVFYAERLSKLDWEVRYPLERVGKQLMAIFIDIYGNEARIVIGADEFKSEARRAPPRTAKRGKK